MDLPPRRRRLLVSGCGTRADAIVRGRGSCPAAASMRSQSGRPLPLRVTRNPSGDVFCHQPAVLFGVPYHTARRLKPTVRSGRRTIPPLSLRHLHDPCQNRALPNPCMVWNLHYSCSHTPFVLNRCP